jgi:peptide/nickel transport system substrate-binding protein/oligopeptide transport system substrate-binding protein
MRLIPYPDAAGSWLQFVRGDLDVAEVPAGQIAAAEKDYGDQGFKPFLAGYYYGLNVRSPGLSRLSVRKAMNRAVDRETIAKTIYKGTLEPPRGIVPAGMPGFQENVCIELCSFAPERAKGLLKGIPARDRRVTLEYTQGEPHREVAQAVAADLQAVGFKVRVKAYPFPAYLKRLRDGRQAMYRLGWIAEFPVADAFLSPLFKSRSPDNHTRYASPRVDALLAEARREPSDNRRIQLYIEAEKEILKSSPVVPIGSFITHWAAQPNVEGIEFDVMGGFDAVNVSIAGSE